VWRLGTVPSESGYRIVPPCHAPAWQSCQWVATALGGCPGRVLRAQYMPRCCGPNHGAASVASTSRVPDLVGLARDGTDAQKENAADALRNCVSNNPANKDAVRNAGGIAVLVGLARDVRDGRAEGAGGRRPQGLRDCPRRRRLPRFGPIFGPHARCIDVGMCVTVRMRMHARAYACLDAPGCAHAEHVGVRASARARVCVRAFVLRARAHICGCPIAPPIHPAGSRAQVKSFLWEAVEVSFLLLLCPRELLSMRLAET
jgi:hypothetical protein